jgi:2-amino-4-hydroxy-6-hydroxymethyldihydropteridine diphosphokinase
VTIAHLGLGSNLGDRLGHLKAAVGALRAASRIEVLAVSRVYETAPVGGPEQGAYLNAVVAIETDLDPAAVLRVAQGLEEAAQRVRLERNGPRTLDVDVLLIGDLTVDEPDLVVPHPRLFDRGFVLAPLADVAPDLVDVPDGGWPGVSLTDFELTVGGP